MSEPIYKIEVYDAVPELIHTITQEALSVHVKKRVTIAPGLFSFAVPTKKNGDAFKFNDIAIDDKVKIWMGAVSGDPFSVGKIVNISAPLSINEGFIRVFTGRDQGEVLDRRQKTKYFGAVNANVIVEEFADDLTLGKTEIEADATPVTLTCINEPYWSVMQRISDYWKDAGTKIKKDFHVDVNNKLVWKSRPWRTSGVEVLQVGINLLSYIVTRNVGAVKNKIHVFGAAKKTYPLANVDALCEGLTDWTVGAGDNIATSTDRRAGAVSIDIWDNDGDATVWRGNIGVQKALFPNRDHFTNLEFWFKISDVCAIPVPFMDVHLQCDAPPSIANGFRWDIDWNTNPCSLPLDTWRHISLPLGPQNESAAKWTQYGTSTWDDIEAFRFVVFDTDDTAVIHLKIDELHFSGARFYNVAASGTPIREYTVIRESLLTDLDCQKRAEALLFQLKDIPIRIDVVLAGNTNLRVGDRLSMTIPAETISAENYDVVEADYTIAKVETQNRFATTASLLNTADKRLLPPITRDELMKEQFRIQRQIASGLILTK